MPLILHLLNHWKKVNIDDNSLERLYKCKYFFLQKEKYKICKYTAKVTLLRCDYFGENQTPLQRNGMAAIPKMLETRVLLDRLFIPSEQFASYSNRLEGSCYLSHSPTH